MSSSRSSSPSIIPFRFRRKSSSASTSVSLHDHMYSREDPTFSSPLPSSSPPLTPLHGTRAYKCPQWDHSNYSDGMEGVSYDQEDDLEASSLPWSCHTQDEKTSTAPHPLPSLMTKFAAQALKNQTSSSFQSPLYAACRTTSYFYPYGDSALADDCEEYDLESMDIHVRETYFATSSERGRWLSSPIATRVRTQTISPRHGQSSPAKTTKTALDASPSAARVCRYITSHSADKEFSTSSSSEDHDEEARFSSPLPPSSPFTSPMSNFSFLPDDWERDEIAEPCPSSSNPNSCAPPGASDLNMSPFGHTSSVGSTCLLSRFEAPDIVLDRSCSTHVSRSPGPCPGHVSTSVDVQVSVPRPPDATSSKLDAMSSSPLSQFDDLPPAEPLPIPLSNTKNTPHSGQPASTLDKIMNIALGTVSSSIDGPPAFSVSVNANHEKSDAIGKPSPNGMTKKRKKSATSHQDVPHKNKRRAIVQLRTTLSDLREKEQERKAQAKGKESHVSRGPEPPKKKSKSSDRSNHPADRRTKPCQRRKPSPTSKSHPHTAIEGDCAGFAPPDGTTSGPAESQLLTAQSLGPVDPADAELYASLTGMLIEALATSRATSMDSSALYLAVTQTHPHLAKERPKQELQVLIATVLESGRAQCGMFEKVDSSGEASRHKALEGRWFYVPDRDEDRERASLISAIMPRQKRSETKKYKQYYYRPLDKISRWDAEDAP